MTITETNPSTDETTTVESTLFGLAGTMAVSGETSKQIGYLLAVVYGMRTGVITFDPQGANGKGRFNGASAVIERIAAEGVAMPQEYRGILSKGCKLVQQHGRKELFAKSIKTDDDIVNACEAFVLKHGGISQYYSELYPSEPKEASLAQMVGNLFAWASKHDIDHGDVVALVVETAQANTNPDPSE